MQYQSVVMIVTYKMISVVCCLLVDGLNGKLTTRQAKFGP